MEPENLAPGLREVVVGHDPGRLAGGEPWLGLWRCIVRRGGRDRWRCGCGLVRRGHHGDRLVPVHGERVCVVDREQRVVRGVGVDVLLGLVLGPWLEFLV
ncbi:MAG: hypothetical protein ABUL57_02025, partial [Chloroflexota bacterium]